MNPLIYVILIIMILFTVYHFWTDIRNAWNTGETFAEGMTNTAPNGYTYTGESQCQDWSSHYVACKTPLDGNGCSIKATTIDECAAECNKRDSCGEMYFKNGVCYLADGKCVPQTNPQNPQPHYKKGSSGAASAAPAAPCMTEDDCKQVATTLGLKLGDGTLPFADTTYATKGLYAYKTGGRAGEAYFGDGGTPEQMKAAVSLPKYRPIPPAAAAPTSAGIVLGQPLNNTSISATPIENTVTTTDDQGNTVTTSTAESSSVDPTTGAKIEKKCISISQLANAGAWVDHLFGALANTKCADKNKVEAAKSASKLDFISGALAPTNSNEHYMKAINKAKPFLDQAFANNQNSLAQGGTNTIQGNNNNLAQGTTESISNNTAQTQAPVTNNIQAPQQPTWQAQQMAQQFQQGQQQQTINGQVLPNGFIVQPGNGKCPNGCKYPQYDNKGCEDTVLNGKSYRKCPWVKDGLNGSDCAECGAILMPKNKFGYARTRPGLFDNVSVNMAIENAESSKKGDYYNIGKNFMNQLSKIKNFNLPNTIDTKEYVSIGKMVHKYQTEETSSSKDLLTKFINEILTTSNISNNNQIQNNSLISEQVNSMGGNFDIDQKKLTMKGAYAYDEGRKEVASDNRLGGSSSMYEKQISEKIRRLNGIPRDPRKKPNPYDSVWDIFKY